MPNSKPPIGASYSVLLVDDNDDLREIIAWELSDHGYRVIQVMSVPEALSAFEADPVDLVITDIHLGRVSGLTLARDLKAKKPELPIVVISDLSHEREARAIEGVIFLAKPFGHGDLLRTLTAQLPPVT